jgi:hypothetical protein
MGQSRQIDEVRDVSASPPIAAELVYRGERREVTNSRRFGHVAILECGQSIVEKGYQIDVDLREIEHEAILERGSADW